MTFKFAHFNFNITDLARSLSFSFRDDGQAGQNQERNNLRNFIGDVLEQETAMDAAVGDLFAGTAWDGKNGLNIRV